MIESLYTVLVNWNLKQDTIDSVASLFAAGARPGQVIVVDNGSSDGSAQALREQFGAAVHVIESDSNLGLAGGCNLGIAYALERQASWIFILNNDTVVDAELFAEWAAQASSGHAIIAPLILYFSAPDRIWYLGDRLIPTSLITRSIGRDQVDKGQFPALVPVDFVCGCGMFIQREVFERIGVFDTSFFMYAEEVDFCQRARASGFRLACATRAKIWHKISVSANRDRPMTRYLRIRNQIHFYRRYARWYQAAPLFGFTLLRALRIAIGDMIDRQPALIVALVRGWADGWTSR